jgi:hypothetical protein
LGTLLAASPAEAQSGNVWQALFYNNPNWQGGPVFTQNPSIVSYNWGSDTPPGPNMPSQFWTARFTTTAFFYAGMYRFQIQADDEFALWIDNALFADTRGANQPGKTVVIDVPVAQGNHFVQIDYRQYTGPAYIFANWSFIKGGDVNPMPPAPPAPPAPPPPPSGSLVTDFGDYTPCMQQQIHQVNCFQSNGAWNAPNAGSIQMEPQILLWERCKPDEVRTKRLWSNRDPVSAKCSKTEAGWFPN